MNNQTKGVLLLMLSFVMLGAGLYFALSAVNQEPSGIMIVLPFVLIGFGSGLIGASVSLIIRDNAAMKNPDYQTKKRIEQNDERNIIVSNAAKAKAFSVSIYLYAAILIAFTLMRVSAVGILILVAAYAAMIVCFIVFYNKLNKEM
ncbi:MAG: hypothetical protein ABFD03_02935 [Clostridiaceae bacterium]